MRRCFNDGGSAVVENKGASEAGAIFFRIVSKDRMQSLFGPAPQSIFDDNGAQTERLFEPRLTNVMEFEINEVLAKELQFDRDIWVVELQIENPNSYFRIVES